MNPAIKPQYVSNEKGEVAAVQIPIETWRSTELKLGSAEEQDWRGVSENEIAAIQAGLRDFEKGYTVSNEEVLVRGRALRNKA